MNITYPNRLRYQSRPHAQVEVLFDASTVAQRVQALGKTITQDYTGKSLCVVMVLKGAFVFCADLIRHIDLPITCEVIGVSSYNGMATSGVMQITTDLKQSLEGLEVLLVEDIVDTGLSLRYLLDNLATRRPRSLRVCALLEKPDSARVQVPIDYLGFQIPNHFIVGYGLDVGGCYRNLPYVGMYREHA